MRVIEHPPQVAASSDVAGLGLAFGLSGLTFIGGGLGALPLPDSALAPLMSHAIGAAFLLVALFAVARSHAGLGQVNVMRVTVIGVAGALVTIALGLAVLDGPRAFGVSDSGPSLGRAVFALGAVIGWFIAIAATVQVVRRLFDHIETAQLAVALDGYVRNSPDQRS